MYEILLVDDEADNLDALERLFRKTYKVYKADSGPAALDVLKKHPEIALILSDQRMPEMTGVEMLKKSIRSHPHCFRILLTGYTDVESIVDSINSGEVYRYLTKPWDPIDLKNTVDKAIEKYNLRQELIIKNNQLEKALEELKTLDQAKSNFMILMNHELKTPLTVITSYLDLLKESSLNEEQKLYVDRLDKSRARLQVLVDLSLELISAETGLIKIQKKKVKSLVLRTEAESVFSKLENKKSIKLESEFEEGIVLVDLEILKKVLFHLLDNAVKFSDSNSLVQIKLLKSSTSGFRLEISNQGPTLGAKVIEKIMKPFSLDENVMNHSKGLGLGLSVTQALLKAHGSGLKIESSKGITTVTIELV
jgi:signal transduction histidine kinase